MLSVSTSVALSPTLDVSLTIGANEQPAEPKPELNALQRLQIHGSIWMDKLNEKLHTVYLISSLKSCLAAAAAASRSLACRLAWRPAQASHRLTGGARLSPEPSFTLGAAALDDSNPDVTPLKRHRPDK